MPDPSDKDKYGIIIQKDDVPINGSALNWGRETAYTI